METLEEASAVFKTLRLVGELGEVIDIIKKTKADEIAKIPKIRKNFVEEVCDCYMYLADLLNCYRITAKEIDRIYKGKVTFNLKNPMKYWKK